MVSIRLTLPLLLSFFIIIQTAAVPSGCYFQGKVYELGQEFVQVDRFKFECQEEGVTCLGCILNDGSIMPLGAPRTDNGFKYECFKNGTQLYYRATAVSQTSA